MKYAILILAVDKPLPETCILPTLVIVRMLVLLSSSSEERGQEADYDGDKTTKSEAFHVK